MKDFANSSFLDTTNSGKDNDSSSNSNDYNKGNDSNNSNNSNNSIKSSQDGDSLESKPEEKSETPLLTSSTSSSSSGSSLSPSLTVATSSSSSGSSLSSSSTVATTATTTSAESPAIPYLRTKERLQRVRNRALTMPDLRDGVALDDTIPKTLFQHQVSRKIHILQTCGDNRISVNERVKKIEREELWNKLRHLREQRTQMLKSEKRGIVKKHNDSDQRSLGTPAAPVDGGSGRDLGTAQAGS